ncbi:MAG: S-layer homology domain-containing protein [Candidatus Peribacteraceae bacterium]|nr:S-layer homology domain-containing protein [Candidatus Peribacteraceae bacterium]
MRPSPYIRFTAFTVVGLLSVSSAAAASFKDISGHRNQTAIQYLGDKGVIGGYSDGTFKPLSTINRAELAKILVAATDANPTVDQYHDCFSDVMNQWFAPYVCYAKEKDWVAGYSDGTFRPEQSVNTVEAIKMILNAQGITAVASATDNTYSDVDDTAWYAPYVETANGKGLLETARGKLGIAARMTRGGVAETIYRVLSIKSSGATRFEVQESSQGSSGGGRGFAQEDLQQYLDVANAASDREELTKEEFQTELASLEKAARGAISLRDQHSSRPAPPSGTPPNFGQMSSRMAPPDDGSRPESKSGGGSQDFLTTASTYLKYTDANDQTVLLAIDVDGKVIMKWPRAFGGHRGAPSNDTGDAAE